MPNLAKGDLPQQVGQLVRCGSRTSGTSLPGLPVTPGCGGLSSGNTTDHARNHWIALRLEPL